MLRQENIEDARRMPERDRDAVCLTVGRPTQAGCRTVIQKLVEAASIVLD
jgi:hypothetical protein